MKAKENRKKKQLRPSRGGVHCLGVAFCCKIAARAFGAARHMNTTHVPYMPLFGIVPPFSVPSRRTITVVSLHFIWFLWKLTMMRLASNIRTHQRNCVYAEKNESRHRMCRSVASSWRRRIGIVVDTHHQYIIFLLSIFVRLPWNRPYVPTNHLIYNIVIVSPQCCHRCHQQKRRASCKWVFILSSFFLLQYRYV